MKSLFVAFLLTCLSSTSFAQELLRCNLSDGDTQEARVIKEGQDLRLDEITSYGAMISRILTTDEWKAKQIRIYTEDNAKASLYYSAGLWRFSYHSSGLSIVATPDCY